MVSLPGVAAGRVIEGVKEVRGIPVRRGRVPDSFSPLVPPCPLSRVGVTSLTVVGGSFSPGDDPWAGLDLPEPDLPVGGRLSYFLPAWKEITQDKWTLSVVSKGLDIPLMREPPLSQDPIFFPPPSDPDKAQALLDEVNCLIRKEAVEELPRSFWTPGFYSRMFLVRKKSGAWRPIIDLSSFNRHVVSPHFKMETPRGILSSVVPEMWATSVDLKDAYFHVPIRKSARKFLRFTSQGRVFQFKALPFGLTTAPLVFTKLLQTVVGYLHSRGVDIHIYFDDSLMLHLNRDTLVGSTRSVLSTLLRLGFIPSREKSEVIPSQDFIFLGNRFLTDSGLVLPTRAKFQRAKELVLLLNSLGSIQVRWFLRLLGFLNSIADVVPLGRLHIRPLQMFLLSKWKPASLQWDAQIPLDPSVKASAMWWASEDNVLKGVSLLRVPPTSTLYTDASMTGWGAYLDGQSCSGTWQGEHLLEHINILEMRAVLLSIQSLRHLVQGRAICLATDNATVVAYLQNQGGTKSHKLCALAIKILLLCQSLSLSLTVRHLPGRLNVLADTLSRSRNPVSTEWTLNRSLFRAICLVWETPLVDLFATSLNFQIQTFVSPVPDPLAWAVDALSLSWEGLLAYAFPPFSLLGRVLQKVKEHDCSILLIAPLWPKQPWFPVLLDLLVDLPLAIPARWNLLSQPRSRQFYQNPDRLHLHAWRLSRSPSCRRAFLQKLPTASQDQFDLPHLPSTSLDGQPSVVGVSAGKLIHSVPLFS